MTIIKIGEENMERLLKFTAEHDMFRNAFGRFLDNEIVPYYEKWEEDMIVPRENI
jgi:acyl-CoA dehydrogenase